MASTIRSMGLQRSIFDGTQPLRVDKPIRLIELFAGYGSQALALKYLGVKFEHYKICEWAIKSIQAYKDLHFSEDNNDYSASLTDLELIDFLTQKGISANYNEPMTRKQVERLGKTKRRKIYNNIKATNNLVNITQVKGKDLDIKDTIKYEYVLTYSFPCQDLSNAGKCLGMAKGSNTRSGMLWEVERILNEIKTNGGEMPQILLMENVPEVIGAKNIAHFAKWLERLERFGYHCYWKCLNAKDYSVLQNRNRCFMISVLGDYLYDFPQSIALSLCLKDLLETNVDEKYYLKDAQIKMFAEHANRKQLEGCGFKFEPSDGQGVAKCISTRVGSRTDDNFIVVLDEQNQRIRQDNCVGTLTTDGSSPKHNNRIVEFRKCVQIGEVQGSGFNDMTKRIYSVNALAPSCRTCGGGNTEIKIAEQCRVRKLTPRECFRLMGVKDEDYEKIAKNQSDSSLYHLAGDSIVTNVLMAIFKEMIL